MRPQTKRTRPDIDPTSFFDDDAEDVTLARPGVPNDGSELDPIYSIYGIHPGLPFRLKVERLIVLWDLNVDEIIDVLREEAPRVKAMVADLNRGWIALGEGLSEDERTLARGKMIKELLSFKAELEKFGDTQDSKIITMKISLAEKIAKLRGVETEKKPAGSDETLKVDPIDTALDKLTPEAKRRLLEQLNK